MISIQFSRDFLDRKYTFREGQDNWDGRLYPHQKERSTSFHPRLEDVKNVDSFISKVWLTRGSEGAVKLEIWYRTLDDSLLESFRSYLESKGYQDVNREVDARGIYTSNRYNMMVLFKTALYQIDFGSTRVKTICLNPHYNPAPYEPYLYGSPIG